MAITELRAVTSEQFRETLTRHYAERKLRLPEVRLRLVQQLDTWWGAEGQKYTAHSPGLRKVGECVIYEWVRPEDNQPERSFSGVGLRTLEHYDQGLGIAIYQEAICAALDDGRDFRADSGGLSDRAIAAWRRLVNLGLATAIGEPYIGGTGADAGQYWHVLVPAHDRVVER